MPLQTRVVEPVRVTRYTVWQAGESSDRSDTEGSSRNDLLAVTNGTCANIIFQLSSLSKHAEEMFGELTRESRSLADRVGSLTIRLSTLSADVKELQSTDEKVSLINTKRAFKSTIVFGQQLFLRNSMSASMREMYSRCDEPPPLYKFNRLRDDGKDCMKLYTDTNCFFNLWRSDTLKASEKILLDREKKLRRPKTQLLDDNGSHIKNTIKQTNNIKERQIQLSTQCEKFITPEENAHYDQTTYQVKSIEYRRSSCTPQINYLHTENNIVDGHITRSPSMDMTPSDDYATPFDSNLMRSKSNEYIYETEACSYYQYKINTTEVLNPLDTLSKIKPPAPQRFDSLEGQIKTSSLAKTSTRSDHKYRCLRIKLPPPPHPPIEYDIYLDESLPPPPPPLCTSPISISPPLLSENVPPPPPLPLMSDQLATFASKELKSHSKQKFSSITQSDPADTNINNDTLSNITDTNRTDHYCTSVDFLSIIKAGVVLRKVENVKEKESSNTVSDDVITILARRLAVEMSDSDSSLNISDDRSSWAEDEDTHCSPTALDNILTRDQSLGSRDETLLPSPPPSLIESNLSFTESLPSPPPSPPPESTSPPLISVTIPPHPPFSPTTNQSVMYENVKSLQQMYSTSNNIQSESLQRPKSIIDYINTQL